MIQRAHRYYAQPLMDGSIMTENYNSDATDGSTLTRIMGLSMFASLLEGFMGGGTGGGGGVNSAVMNSIRLFILGAIVEGGRRFFYWAVERFKLFRTYVLACDLLGLLTFFVAQNIQSRHNSRKVTRRTNGFFCFL